METITILGLFDVTDRNLPTGTSDAEFSRAGYVPARRTFRLADNDFFLAPFGDGILGGNRFRNAAIEVVNESGETVFKGVIQDAATDDAADEGTVTTIEAVSAFGSVATFPVEGGSNIFATVNGAIGAGSSIIPLESGSAALGEVATISFTANNSPRYLVTDDTGSPVTSVTISPPLVDALADGAAAVIDVPRTATPAGAIKAALELALTFIGQADLIDDASFDMLSAEQAADGYAIWDMVRAEDRISLGDYIAQILAATGMFLSEAPDGTIQLISGPGWDGVHPGVTITDDWIVAAPSRLYRAGEANPFIYAYSHVYASGSGVGIVNRALSDQSPNVVNYGPTAVSIPFPPGGENLSSYKILYADEATAEAYGETLLSYYSVDRRRADLTIVLIDSDGATLGLRQFQPVLLSATLSGKVFTNEPCRVISIKENEEENTATLTLELINEVWPALTKPA